MIPKDMIGIQNGMVMQRNKCNLSEILLYSDEKIISARYTGASSGQLDVQSCKQGWILSGIPAGGPYEVIINEQKYHDIYVGDVWILAGQSNMEGVGWLTDEDKNFPGIEQVRAFYMDDHWDAARHRLHRPWLAVDKVHTEYLPCNPGLDPEKRGVGPGLSFALKMHQYTGVPQGLICCAHGGTTMKQWSPQLQHEGTDKSLFAAMVRRFYCNGSHVRGMFWYQGCSEAMIDATAYFEKNMYDFFGEVRHIMGEDMPIVQVQIGNYTCPEKESLVQNWTVIREKQRTLQDQIPYLDTVSAIGFENDDSIHLSSEAQKQLGLHAAESMYRLICPDDNTVCLPAPRYKGHRVLSSWLDSYSVLQVEYENLHEGLFSKGKPNGFQVSPYPDKIPYTLVCNIKLEGSCAMVRVESSVDKLQGWYLFYGYGVNPYCNITDGVGRSIPGMGPVRIAGEGCL